MYFTEILFICFCPSVTGNTNLEHGAKYVRQIIGELKVSEVTSAKVLRLLGRSIPTFLLKNLPIHNLSNARCGAVNHLW